jgi:starch synthase
MPSRFEPCGLGQMIAMRYGTVPVVRATGGLADTVNSKVGFMFKEFSADELNITLQAVLKVFANEKKWQQLQKSCMQQDFSWNKSAKEYLRLYRKLSR